MDVRAITADVSNEEDCRKLIDDTVNHYGRCESCMDSKRPMLIHMIIEHRPLINIIIIIIITTTTICQSIRF
jgi:NAD(P)-dependent dehydrogenase (short-subunit alcohol dehydrogenase family)